MTELGRTREWYDVDLDVFREQIAPSRVPAILRGLAADWPAVRAGRQDSATLREYLRKFDTGKPAPAFLSHPDIKGRFWYREDMAASTIDKKLPHQSFAGGHRCGPKRAGATIHLRGRGPRFRACSRVFKR